MINQIKNKIFIVRRKLLQVLAKSQLSANKQLWSALVEYITQSSSTGCNHTDYLVLYKQIRQKKPQEVLELGTGVSTLVIAHALYENAVETGTYGRVTSMEESSEWLEMSRALLPDKYRTCVDFCLSGTVEDKFSLYRGVRYEVVPERKYDYVFIDGPSTKSPLDGTPTFDFDLLNILRTAERPISGLIDKRVSTCFVLQQILGKEKLRYDPILHLGFITNCSKNDLKNLTSSLSSENFENSFRLFGKTQLSMSS